MSDNSILSSYLFTVEIDGIETARFQKCEGLEAETEVLEIEEGGGGIRHLRGRTRYPNLILEKGINENNELFKWYEQTFLTDGKIERKNGSVVLKDSQGNEIKRWNFFRAFPCRWIGPRLNYKDKNTFTVERIEIAHEGLELDDSSLPFMPSLELKIDRSKWIAQAGTSDTMVFFDNYGNPTSNQNVVNGLNIGETADIPTTTKIINAAENHLGEDYFDNNTCDEWAAKVLSEAGFSPADYHLEDTNKTVKQHIDDLIASQKNFSNVSNNSAYVVFMGDGTKDFSVGHEHCGLLVSDKDGNISFYHSSSNNKNQLSKKENYNNLSEFENDFLYSSFYYQEIQ